MIRVPLREGRTLHHDVRRPLSAPARSCCARRRPGTGIIAGGPMRAIFEALGVQDVVAKSIGTSNPHNMIKATFEALQHLNSPRAVAARRGKKVGDLLGRRDDAAAEAAKGARRWPNGKTTSRSRRSAARSGAEDQRATLIGPGPQQAPPQRASSRTRRGARHDQQGAPSGAYRRGSALSCLACDSADDGHEARTRSATTQAPASTASASGAASARARARPPAAAEGPEGAHRRRDQRLRRRPDAAPPAAAEARLQQHRSARTTRSSISVRLQKAIDAGKLDAGQAGRCRGAGRGRVVAAVAATACACLASGELKAKLDQSRSRALRRRRSPRSRRPAARSTCGGQACRPRRPESWASAGRSSLTPMSVTREVPMASAAEQLAANINFGAFAKATELKSRIWFTLGAPWSSTASAPTSRCPASIRGVLHEIFQRNSRRHPRHVRHVLGRRARAHDDLRARTSCRTSRPRSSCSC